MLKSQRQTPKNQPPLAHTTTHNNNKKHCHRGPPKLPASNGSNFTGEYKCHTLRNRSWSLQHGDITYNDKTYCSVMLFTIILQAVTWCTCGQQVSFISYYSWFFGATASEQRALTSAIRQYFICQYLTNTSHISAWFWMRGGGRHCHNVFMRRGRLRLLLA